MLAEIAQKMITERHAVEAPKQRVVEKEPVSNYEPEQAEIITSTLQTPRVNGLDDIVGLDELKKTLRILIILPKTQPQLFNNRKTCNNFLLFGPPGTGKTRIVHAIAAEAHAKFHCVLASDILSHFVGQTEKYVFPVRVFAAFTFMVF